MSEPEFAENVANVLIRPDVSVTRMSDSMAALDVLEEARNVELLVTCFAFPPGKPNGLSLARMARVRRPGIKVLFVGSTDQEQFAAGIGPMLHSPVVPSQVADTVLQMLGESDGRGI